MNNLKQQAIVKFNLQIAKLINLMRDLVATKDEDTDVISNYATFETIINNILVPLKPTIIIELFGSLICENTKYKEHIKQRNDSLFSSENIFQEYNNVYKAILKSKGNADFIMNVVKNTIKDLGKGTDNLNKLDISKIDCDKVMDTHREKIEKTVDKYRIRWDQIKQTKKTEIWTTLNIMVYLVDKYFPPKLIKNNK